MNRLKTRPCGLCDTDTLVDAFNRADCVSGENSYSGTMTTNKDLRRVVLLAYELRKTSAMIETLQAAVDDWCDNFNYDEYFRGEYDEKLFALRSKE